MKQRYIIIIHFLFWIVYVFNTVLTYESYYITHYGFWNIAFKQFTVYMTIVTVFYINYIYAVPGLLSKNRYWSFGFAAAGLIILNLILLIFQSFLMDWYFAAGDYFIKDRISGLSYFALQAFFYLVISTGARFTGDWFRDRKLREELDREKTQSELSMLRYQLSPHFLFNTLNNIYALVNKKSDTASEAVLMLSNIMRYVLSESPKDRVPLENEINYLNSFIELQKLRMANPDIVKLNIEGKPGELKISPMILIPFVENAFKHGDLSSLLSVINISLTISRTDLIFIVENMVRKQSKDSASGIGLHNLKRRLELLYKNKYTLDILETKSVFKISLKLELERD